MSAAQPTSDPLSEITTFLTRAENALNHLWDWIVTTPNLWFAVAVVLVMYFVLIFLRGGVILGLRQLARGRDASWPGILCNVIARSGNLFFLTLAIYVGSRFVILPEGVNIFIRNAALVMAFIQAAAWTSQLLVSLLTRRAALHAGDGGAATNALSLIQLLVRIFVWSTALLLVLTNLGVNVTALVAGLGIGGIAIGFAAQGILSDLFASLSIVLDRPFVTGDFITFGDMKGTVERIGLKNTRIRSLSGEQIIVSNGDLLNSRIRNFKHMNERRVAFTLGVTYQTPPEKLEAIPDIIRAAVEAQERTRFDRAHFMTYGDSALIFEAVYFVLSPEYATYMDIHQNVNMTIFRRFADAGIEFAYPTRTLHLAGAIGGGQHA